MKYRNKTTPIKSQLISIILLSFLVFSNINSSSRTFMLNFSQKSDPKQDSILNTSVFESNDQNHYSLINPYIKNRIFFDDDDDTDDDDDSNRTTTTTDDNDNTYTDGNGDDEEENDDEEDEEDKDDDEVDDDIEIANERNIEIEIEDESATISSEFTNGEIQNEISIEMSLEEGIQFDLEYETQNGTNSSEYSLSVLFFQVLEFTDNNHDYHINTPDTILQEYPLDDFEPIHYSPQTQKDNSTLHYIRVDTTDGIFSLHVYLSGEFQKLHNTTLIPTQIKLDIEFNNFPFQQNSSYLALETHMIAEREVAYEEETEDERNGFTQDEESLTLASDNIGAFLSWAKYAEIDGNTLPVLTNFNLTHQTEEEQDFISLFFNYPQGESIYHDPRLGMQGILMTPSPPPTSTTFFSRLLNFLTVNLHWVILFTFLIFAFTLILSKSEYKDYLMKRVMHINPAPHKLSMEEVLENEYRDKIIDTIMDNPGIHYQELYRTIETSPSNLAWHLDILESYKIIKKQRVGQYLIYYPYLQDNPFKDVDPRIFKSKTTLHILDFITEEPGITQKTLAKRLDLHRKTIKYHLDKLFDAHLIESQKEGRRKLLFIKAQEIQDVPEET